ncbi:uncharacterized protein [Clytia hemisphaerica]|uniref:uncharacterized protein n=1 Tax=Clytia hemisphaerica TaxID=252671 RepID=UPI0034D60DFC
MVDVEKLGKKRNALTSYVNKLILECEEWNKDAKSNKNALETTCKVLNKKLQIIIEITDNIVDELDDEEQMGIQYEKCSKVERRVESLILAVKSELSKENPKIAVSDSSVTSTREKQRKADIRLPKLSLKPYDGDPLKWKTFFDTFDCAVHQRDDMTNVEKMTYLTSLLEGEAESCIQGITLSNENYDIALKMLKERKFGKDVWAIDKLLEALQQEVEAREKVLLTENEGVENYENLMSTGRPTDSKRRQPFRTFPCVYCGNASHKAYQCSKISKPESRKDFLIKQKRCFKCLKIGHDSKSCRSMRSCYHCRKNHHSSICKTFKKEEDTPEDTQSNLASSSSTVLLQTAKAKIENVEKNRSSESRIFFDPGSQLSYVTPTLSRKLNLKQIGKKELCIQSFGNNKTVKTLPLVEFNVKTSKGQVPVQAYVSEISQPVSRQNTVECQKRFEHLKGLKLADPNHEKAIDIDILIGSNFYWDFIHTEGAVTGKSGQPIALSSSLGYVLSGPADLKEKISSGIFFSHVLKAVISENDRLSETVDKFWDLESLGIKCENFDRKT